MAMINGITVKLYEKKEVGRDDFNAPIYEETATDVENVLVSPTSSTDIIDQMNLYGKKAVYTLGIPKGDIHNWEDATVEFFGHKWHTFGFPIEGIENLIPLGWNKKVTVERYGEKSES